ncbi:unnamed protein product [Mytilus edulis]|uniref:Uncharacterized protein n=1 Tax=Mytilus edulis TaxID=6550 RepID=A0A8S3RRQ4_MYTED|nr:unnamed protein product [Mytilus edulis]
MSSKLNDTLLLAKYHSNCLLSLCNRASRIEMKKDIVELKRERQILGIAFSELFSYINETGSCDETISCYKLSDLCKLYMERITCLGADVSFRVNSSRLKDRIVSNFPDLDAYKQGRENILAFKDDIGPALKRVGFKFAPVPYSNVPELKADINNFSRRLRLKEEFGNKKDHDKSLVRNKSTYTPRPGKDDYLDTYIETITKFPVRTRKCKQNLTRNEQDALKSLKDDDSIIIKEADKGGAIIIMDTDFYKEKVLEQLNDEEYYKQVTNNPDKATKKRLKKLIKDYDQCLTEKEIAYLCDFDPKESNFYGLPKVHKSAQIQNTVRDQNNIYVETFRPADLKLRPIIAGPESLTQRLSHFIDLVIKHLCPSIPSYIKDDMEFLNHIPVIVPEETLLTSFDVTSLYTNIPHDLGLTAVKYWIEEKRDEIDSRFETNFILEATKIVLEENTFYFDGKNTDKLKVQQWEL